MMGLFLKMYGTCIKSVSGNKTLKSLFLTFVEILYWTSESRVELHFTRMVRTGSHFYLPSVFFGLIGLGIILPCIIFVD